MSGGWYMRTDELSIQKSQLGIHTGRGPASATRSADSQRYALRQHNVEDTIVHRVPPDPGGDRTFNLLFVLGTSYLVSGGRLERNDVLGWNSPCLGIAGGDTFRRPTRRFNRDENVAAVLRRRHCATARKPSHETAEQILSLSQSHLQFLSLPIPLSSDSAVQAIDVPCTLIVRQHGPMPQPAATNDESH